MRKLSLLIVLAMMLMAAFPVFAQDESNTIADIVVASASAEEDAEFTVLLAAVQAADPSFLEVLSGDYPYTVFAPTDAAFVALLEALDTSAEDLLANTDLLNTVLAYHVVPGPLDSTYFVGAAEDGALVGTALYESALAFSFSDDDSLMVNDATVIGADIMADNGYVHVIDTVLVPEMSEEDDMMEGDDMMEEPVSIAETVIAASEADEPQFTILLAAVLAADEELPAILTDMGPFTVFAPTDDAFAALLEALEVSAEDLLADTELLNQVLAYHLVPGHFAASTVVAVAGADGGVNVATIEGSPINVALDGESVVLNGEITVIATDIHASNGMIHVIDGVLLPPEDME